MTARYQLRSGTACELLSPRMPGVPDYHVLALDRPATDDDLDELVSVGARIACRLGRELRGDAGAFTMIVNGHRASRRPWAHVHIIPVDTPARKRRAFAFLFLKGPLRRLASVPVRRAARPRAKGSGTSTRANAAPPARPGRR